MANVLAQLRTALGRARELRQLDRARSSRPRGCELVKLDHDKAVWRVPVPGQDDRFMSARSGGIDREKFVVQVDTELFYRTWLAGTSAWGKRDSGDCVLRSEMPADYKYRHAVSGFSQGPENPVPLAEVDAWRDGGKVRVGFTNGITRTFWLIANRAPAFPVEVVGRQAAELLHHAAGFGPAPVCYETMFAAGQRRQPTMPPKAEPADPARVRTIANKIEPRPGRSGPRRGRSL
ncbi:TPA: fertility inhibition factor FiwA [Salmonella enterica subsp. enterica serovar Typhimurium str. D23580]|nr:fertility inhibition factor FiwA [Salmonella enterica subsp. enterica serovar Typhimurium str. D23580]